MQMSYVKYTRYKDFSHVFSFVWEFAFVQCNIYKDFFSFLFIAVLEIIAGKLSKPSGEQGWEEISARFLRKDRGETKGDRETTTSSSGWKPLSETSGALTHTHTKLLLLFCKSLPYSNGLR